MSAGREGYRSVWLSTFSSAMTGSAVRRERVDSGAHRWCRTVPARVLPAAAVVISPDTRKELERVVADQCRRGRSYVTPGGLKFWLELDAFRALMAELDRLLTVEAERDTLREAFEEYANHTSWRCQYRSRYGSCLCGLDDLMVSFGLATVPPDDPEARPDLPPPLDETEGT